MITARAHRRATKPFYGWVVVLAGMLSLAAGVGMFNSTNSVFVKPVCEELGFLRGEFTLHRTIITLASALLMPVYGKLAPKFGVKRVLTAGALGLGLVTIGYSFANRLWHFYLLAGLNGLFYNGVGFMTVGLLVSEWFHKKKGFATGLAYAGSGLGGAIMVPVVERMISAWGWRWGYRGLGLVGLAILLPTILLLVKERPGDVGLEPYGGDAAQDGARRAPTSGIAMRDALKTPIFWLLMVGLFLIAFNAAGPNTHSAPYLSDLGYAPGIVSAVVSLFMLMLMAGKVALGLLYDRLGTLLGNLFVGLCCVGFPVAALLAQQPAMPWVYAVLLGLGSAGFSVPVTVLLMKYFGGKDFPNLFSLCSMVTAFGGALSMPAMGTIYDATGSYRWAWLLLLASGMLITVCLLAADILFRRQHRIDNKVSE